MGKHCCSKFVIRMSSFVVCGIIKVCRSLCFFVLFIVGWLLRREAPKMRSPEAVINAIKYAEANGASICNLSLGSTKYLPELEEQIKNSSMLFVAAAGNGDMNGVGYDTEQSGVYPASFSSDNIISVANMMFNGELDVSSNYGAQTVDVAAPGSYILSTTPGNTFEFLTGTSMAAPIVTGIAAFVYSYRPDLSLLQVKEAILNTVVKEDCLSGKVSSGGYPDAYAAMNYGRENTDNTD